MKKRSILLVVLSLGIAGLLTHQAYAKKGGTSILHWMLTTSMTSSGAETGTQGTIVAKQNEQGHANNQRLAISLSGLQSNGTYDLEAQIGADTNLVVVVPITADANGKAVLDYVKKNNGNGHAGGDPLPAALDPISDIRGLFVVNASTQTVLSADLTDPDRFQYLIKRPLTNDGADSDASGSLRIHGTTSATQFRLRAAGLDPSASYYLVLNDAILATETTDAKGGLNITALPGGSPAALDITSLAIQDSNSNNVLSTTLP